MHKILFVDVETGGLNPQEHSLLSIGLVAWKDNEIIDKREIFILSPIIKFTSEALRINKIDFLSFIERAYQPSLCMEQYIKFCIKNFEDFPITLGGHNIASCDIPFLKSFLKSRYSTMFSHRIVDTASIIKFLYMSGKLPHDCSSSIDAFDFFHIDILRKHSALNDAIAIAKLYTKLVELNKKKG